MKNLPPAIRRVIETHDGTAGIAVLHLPSQRTFFWNENTAFPMASTYKIPLAIYALHLIEQKKFTLHDKVEITSALLRPGSSLLTQRLTPPLALSIENLIRLLLEVSDNTVADILLEKCGGAEKLTGYLRQVGISHITVAETALQSLARQGGIRDLLNKSSYSIEKFLELEECLSEEQRAQARADFYLQSKDTATPAAMVELLKLLIEGKLISASHTEFVWQCMQRCITGLNRIRAGLPTELKAGDKTGTLTGITNDIAIVQLAKNQYLLIAIYLKEFSESMEAQEKIMAEISTVLLEMFS